MPSIHWVDDQVDEETRKKIEEEVKAKLEQTVEQTVPHQSAAVQEQSLTPDNKTLAILSFVLGLVGLGAWYIPLLGFPVTIVGLIVGKIGQKSSKKTLATIGIVLSILGLIATIVNSAIGAYMGATGQLQL